jgi:Uma2 family endonuclease
MSQAAGLLNHPWIARRKLDVIEYERMGAAGILHEDDRVELIEGELIAMAPIGERHAGTSMSLTMRLVRAVDDRAIVSVGNPVRLDMHNEPQPDFALLRPKPGGYLGGKPRPEDVLLLIELSDSTLRFDRTVKLPLYGGHGIREYWILNLAQRVAEVCRGPHPDGYARVEVLGPDSVLEPEALPGLRLPVAELIPA